MSQSSSQEARVARYRRCLAENPLMYRTVQHTPPVASEDTIGTVGRYVLAPALGGFVRWTVHTALKSGKKRLYFLARDGYFFYLAARIYCEKQGLPLDCRYLYGSRYALRVPLFHRDREGALDDICRDGLHVSPSRVLDRAGLSGSEKAAILARLPLPFAPDERIPAPMLPQLRQALSGCEAFLKDMERRSREALPELMRYLRQEGLAEEIPYAIVDSGWVGSMQKSLGEALALLGRKRPLEGYYWGLYDLPPGARRSTYHPYFFGPENHLERKAYFNNCLFEAVYTAPHGTTRGYRQEGETFRPVLSPPDEGIRAFVRRLEPVLLAYIGQLAETAREEPGAAEFARDRRTIAKLFRLFMASPTRREAEAFGRLAFSDDVTQTIESSRASSVPEAAGTAEKGQLAAPLSAAALRAGHVVPRLLAAAGLRDNAQQSAWYEGSAVLAAGSPGWHLGQYRLYQYLRLFRQSRRYHRQKRREPRD